MLIWISRASLMSRSSFRPEQRPRDPLALDEHDALRGERFRDPHVLVRERAVAAIDDLQHADERTLLDQRDREHAAHIVVVVEVDRGVEQRLGTAIGHIDDCRRRAVRPRMPRSSEARIGGVPGRAARQHEFAVSGSYSQIVARSARSTRRAASPISASTAGRSKGAASRRVTSRICSSTSGRNPTTGSTTVSSPLFLLFMERRPLPPSERSMQSACRPALLHVIRGDSGGGGIPRRGGLTGAPKKKPPTVVPSGVFV